MGRSVLKVGNYKPEEIKDLIKSNEKYGIGIKLNAIYQVSLGNSSRGIGQFYNTSFKQINNWVHRFVEEGIEGLKDKPGRGRKSKLNDKQKQSLIMLLEENNPEKYGYNSAVWTGPMLIEWISKNFNVDYKKAQIYNIIKSLGFTYTRGKGTFPEASKEKQEVFKKTLKKTSGRKS